MSKFLKRQVLVGTKGDLPWRMFLKGEWLQIEKVIEQWRETGRWWENEMEKDFFLIQTNAGGFLLCRENSSDRWVLYKALD